MSTLLALTCPGDPTCPTSATDVFGTVAKPAGVAAFDTASGGSIGIVLFFSNAIKIVTVVAGLIVFLNIIGAGLSIIGSSGDASATEKAKNQIVNSVLGLALIVVSYVIIALISLVLFGDPLYILNPTISGPVAQ